MLRSRKSLSVKSNRLLYSRLREGGPESLARDADGELYQYAGGGFGTIDCKKQEERAISD